jgi:hypothetical protein
MPVDALAGDQIISTMCRTLVGRGAAGGSSPMEGLWWIPVGQPGESAAHLPSLRRNCLCASAQVGARRGSALDRRTTSDLVGGSVTTGMGGGRGGPRSALKIASEYTEQRINMRLSNAHYSARPRMVHEVWVRCRRPCRRRGCSWGGGRGFCEPGRSASWCEGRHGGRRSGRRAGRRLRRAWS